MCVESKPEACTGVLKNEEFHYVEPRYRTKFIDRMWDLGQAVNESRYIEVDYYRTKDKKSVHRKLQPVAIMFSEYYFYLIAFIEDKEVKKDFDVLNDSFPTIYQKVKFQYTGADNDAVLDRLPTAKVLDEINGIYTVSAEVFGKGIDMWLRSQGDLISEIEYLEGR